MHKGRGQEQNAGRAPWSPAAGLFVGDDDRPVVRALRGERFATSFVDAHVARR